ncbi:glucose/arabinose dehydrogenase [Actinophytocola algeriensis]|uniref:Glucose/arabinose dehydrogenase n=1 Tax=Actinophytocola algeriensis TaxID=1768010 RepID=A0A7W7QCC4_9PSEU|nr:glucose/arabinose dehydrogenase [Actinophytocola algeriensis]MBE1473662.1 glucose/arabinose dehydrogenase [Actinophytocola algeriensis]
MLGMVVLMSCAEPAGETAAASSPDVEVVADELEAPWSIAFHGETPLVSERDTTRVLELDRGGNTREVATIAGATPNGEGGLLGIAVHDGHVYAYFTADGENRLERYALTGDPGALALGSADTILDGLPSASYHNGGRIAFGPDGMLYVTVGDAGNRGSAQEHRGTVGKILRMTPDGQAPDDNPFPGSLVYSYGHRNPQGIAWGENGTLYASEFGQDIWDELNVIEPGGNYGWPEVEGIAERDGFVDPVLQWAPADASPSGIAVSGNAIHIANLRGQRLREVPLGDLANSSERFSGEYGRLRDVVVAPDGALWLLTNNTDGRGDPSAGDDRILRLPAV